MGGSPAKIVKKVVKPIATIVTPRPGTIGGPPAPKPKPVVVAPPKPVTPVAPAPTAAEVSQSAATDMDQSTTSRKVKRRGRSATILTSTAGVDESVTLGTKSLLGG